MYHLINAKALKDQGNHQEAIQTLQTALTLANQQDDKSKSGSDRTIPFTRTERVTLFLEMADVYRADGQTKEAASVMQDAMAEFQGKNNQNQGLYLLFALFICFSTIRVT